MNNPLSLVNARTGVVRSIEARAIPAHFPASFALSHAVLADSRAFSKWPSDASGAGYSFANPEAVLGAAIGEAVERYCGNLVPAGLKRASRRDVQASGAAAIGLQEFCLFSQEQYARPGFPVPAPDADTVIDWVPAQDLVDGTEVLIPASMVWVAHSLFVAPVRHPVIQAGLATGRTLEEARWGGLCEVIERDAMTLSWTGGRGVHELSVPQWLADFSRGPEGRLRTRWLLFATEFGVPVIGALVFDETTGYLTLGMGAGGDPVATAQKAYGEALQLQLFVSDYDDPHGPYMAAAQSPSSPLKPWRQDRCYSQEYAADLSDVVDYGCHLQLHMDPGIQRRFLDELETSIRGRLALDELSDEWTGEDRLERLVSALASRGHRVLCVEATTEDIAPTGLRVVRMVVPGLYSNAPQALPFLGGTRLHPAIRRSVPLPH
ncbi:YcaO-like family protein [Arthrobacter sp. AZCC_0090]|uniref:YcaO-like family protein n=1 Tax=Arthrobacter sp. AZCC_0090 TaxID=2735881 RepID=UPI001610EBB0|nr:YcaO-like family protein [Arthrobacter sp. AZCC_0090]MBB6403425.1 ribosomal protein S12 methylthiotransferase accessory factor [Arthrobacter sp. AZCC_0090]